ncbi:ATP-binding protein [soil metagenome]
MFWRLFLSFLIFVIAAVAAVGIVILRRNEGEQIFAELAREVIVSVTVIAVLATIPAYFLARRFTRPLEQLSDGANRLADGDLGHTIHAGGSREFTALARTFNAMSERLADTFGQLGRDRERLRTILSGMVEGVVAIDPLRRVLFANDRAGELLDFDPASAVGRPLSEVTRHQAVLDLIEKAIQATEPHRTELDIKSPVEKHIALYAARLPGPQSPGAVLVLNDTTELRQLERLRQDFVANVSHELKTPLSVIKSNIEALQDGAIDDARVRGPFFERVMSEADRLGELIQDLMRLAHIESGDLGLELVALPVAEQIDHTIERQSTHAEAKTLQMIEVPPREPVAVRADEEALTTILDNLINNAIKYTINGGKITVRWTATPHYVTIDVQDTGIGIAESDLPRVFERFYRADKARSRAAGGTGLGLAIVKHLVQALKGTVKVTSELGQGSIFSVTLPRADL